MDGPLIKDKATFYFSGRRTFFDLFTRSLNLIPGLSIYNYYFQDYTFKSNIKINKKNRLYLSSYGGNDRFSQKVTGKSDDFIIKNSYIMGWGNVISSLRWNYLVSNKIFSNLTFFHSNFTYKTINQYQNLDVKSRKVLSENMASYKSGVNDLGAKYDFDVYSYSFNQIRLGLEGIYHKFSPGINNYNSIDENDAVSKESGKIYYNSEFSAYVENKLKIKAFEFNAGLRLTNYFVDKTIFNAFQPRLSILYSPVKSIDISASYNRLFQPFHLITNSSVGTPSDLWLPIMNNLPPQHSDQLSMGLCFSLPYNVKLSAEVYYKELYNLIELNPYVIVDFNSADWQNSVVTGTGKAKGIEFQITQNIKKLSYTVNYTLSNSTRLFEKLNLGMPYPYKYGSKHNISAFLVYSISELKSLTVSWVYNSGYYLSLPYDKYPIIYENTSIIVQNNVFKNNFKSPSIHHLDISYSSKKIKKRGIQEWNYGIYNLYSRINPFYIYFYNVDVTSNNPKSKLVMVGLFPIIPSISYTFSF